MNNVIKLAVTKWLESGEFCEAIFTDADNLHEFAKAWQMTLDQDKDAFPNEEVPVGIYEVVLNQDEEHNYGATFDALMDLGRAMDCCHIDDLLRLLFFEGFKAGVTHKQKAQLTPS